MLREMPAPVFFDWLAYAELEPFTEERADLRSAQIAMIIANANRDRKSRPQPFSIKDFMPTFDKEPETAEDKIKKQQIQMQMLAAFTGGILRKGNK